MESAQATNSTLTLIFNYNGWSDQPVGYSDKEITALCVATESYAKDQGWLFDTVRNIQRCAIYISTDGYSSQHDYTQNDDYTTECERAFERIIEGYGGDKAMLRMIENA